MLLGLHVGCTNLYSNRMGILNNPRSDRSKTDLEKTYVTVLTAEEERITASVGGKPLDLNNTRALASQHWDKPLYTRTSIRRIWDKPLYFVNIYSIFDTKLMSLLLYSKILSYDCNFCII